MTDADRAQDEVYAKKVKDAAENLNRAIADAAAAGLKVEITSVEVMTIGPRPTVTQLDAAVMRPL